MTEIAQGKPQVFLLPDLGEGLTEAELVNWLVAVGDEVHVDQPIAEVETAKSMVEVPTPYAGIVTELHGQPGETIDVGRPLITVSAAINASEEMQVEKEEVGEKAAESGSTEGSEAAAADTYRTEERAGSGNVLIGYGTSGGGEARRTRPKRSTATGATGTEATLDFPVSRTRIPGKLSAVISPLVRKMARDHGVSLEDIAGTGDSGLIMRRDVEAAIAHTTVPEPAVREAPQPVAMVAVPGSFDSRTGLGVTSREPVRGVRKAIAATMARSRREIPEATVWVDADATALIDLRAGLKKQDPNNTPSLLSFIARFVTAGLGRYPELNTRIESADDGSQEIVAFDGINLGIAAQTDRGLVVPSIRHAEKLNARRLDAEIRRLTTVAREGKATPEELGSGTFTLNNYGVFGVDGSAAIINYPEVAILGLGRIIDKPWVVDGQLAVRKVTELTLAFDHRVCDGATAAGFLRFVAECIQNPGGAVLDL
ncbi:dihydrolipoamide acetyltransferase family protein [Arthrobacter sp. M4]|uniref:dihydrolipoamide acetyltransferase family protein n=1 Tax=Arthrobacter sp. M4 TaxID=218160 RepID=UPI001CDC9B2A|nr:dihydrolipoamide acetyltransferase family protein [Arthrobacter sp. M4]MCA4133055.1 2-oxo acid dehydrogenase subunit E2 [Arthrobacter sp. M4]